MCTEIWHHEQTQVVHQLDLNQNEGHTFEFHAEHLLALIYEEFNVFRQEYMTMTSSEPKSQQPGPTTPMTTLTVIQKEVQLLNPKFPSITSNRVQKGCISLSHLQE